MRHLLLALITITLLVAPATTASAQSDPQVARRAVSWVEGAQQPDGSFPGFGPGDTADAVIALVAAAEDPSTYTQDNSSPIDYLRAQAADYAATGPGAAAKLAMAVIAAGEDPTSFEGLNLLETIGQGYDPATGQYGPDIYGHALALLAVKSAGAAPSNAAVGRLLDTQLEDGGWSFDGTADTGSDTNTTGLALQALAGLRQADGARARALTYLEGQQNDDGGFPYSQSSQFGNATDANSTAAVIMGLTASGEDIFGERWAQGRNNPFTALAALQNDSGAFRFQEAQADDNAVATYAALTAALGATLPVSTARISGAADLLVPTASSAASTTPSAAPGLPATGAAESLPTAGLLLAGLALAASGLALRRAAAR